MNLEKAKSLLEIAVEDNADYYAEQVLEELEKAEAEYNATPFSPPDNLPLYLNWLNASSRLSDAKKTAIELAKSLYGDL